jgi:hypothetical protein
MTASVLFAVTGTSSFFPDLGVFCELFYAREASEAEIEFRAWMLELGAGDPDGVRVEVLRLPSPALYRNRRANPLGSTQRTR